MVGVVPAKLQISVSRLFAIAIVFGTLQDALLRVPDLCMKWIVSSVVRTVTGAPMVRY